jgi:hypothetical protein
MGEVEDCIIFGITSLTGRAILFHAIMENGAVFYRLPISAFIQRGFKPEEVPKRRLDELELWNSFSYYPAVTTWDILGTTAGKFIGKDKKWHYGKYLFTVDWGHPDANILNSDHSEIPHEHKCAHIIALDNGNYAAQPNNRCIWKTEDTDNFFYEIEEKMRIRYGDSQDGLQIYSSADSYVLSIGYICKTGLSSRNTNEC